MENKSENHEQILQISESDFDDPFSVENISENLNDEKAESYNCQFCNKAFKLRCILKRHVHSHTKPFKCKFCEKSYSQKSVLEYHEVNAHLDPPEVENKDQKTFNCKVCGKFLKNRTTLKRHLTLHFGETKKAFKCNICKKLFTQRQQINCIPK